MTITQAVDVATSDDAILSTQVTIVLVVPALKRRELTYV